jgi:hypothetical protein
MLESTLKRLGLSSEWGGVLEEAFRFAMEEGGADELDFTREEGASFNPRPARLAHILIHDGEVRDPAVIVEAILASVPGGKRPNSAALPRRRLQTVEESSLIAAVRFLDRARHLHIAEKQGGKVDWEQHVRQGEQLVMAVREKAPRLSFVLASWCERVRSRLQDAVGEEQ